MCGIFGYLGQKITISVLLEGLRHLEYRGHDSAGIAVIGIDGRLRIVKQIGGVHRLAQMTDLLDYQAHIGIGHTRWATHGSVTQSNAHPHLDCSGTIAIVHNGIVENNVQLRKSLDGSGHRFISDTDTEVVCHLFEEYLYQGLNHLEAVQKLGKTVKGSNAFLIVTAAQPQNITAVKLGNAGGIIIGYTEDQIFLSSDPLALAPHTRKAIFLEDGDIAQLSMGSNRYKMQYFRSSGARVRKKTYELSYDPASVTKEPYPHYMLKEIMEQPETVLNCLRGRIDLNLGRITFGEEVHLSHKKISRFSRILLTGCGTSFHAALIGRNYFEELTGLPSQSEVASELHHRRLSVASDTLVIVITQSGETADALTTIIEAQRQGAYVVVLSNTRDSRATHLANATINLRGGPEIAVASTKTFIASLVCLYLLAMFLGQERGYLKRKDALADLHALARLPNQLSDILENVTTIEELATTWASAKNFIVLGRGMSYPVALEAALKLQEVTYTHALACPGGEIKHGPIALVDEVTPILILAPDDLDQAKTLNDIAEVRARGGQVTAFGNQDDLNLKEAAQATITVPQTIPRLNPILLTVPLQLVAYYIAKCLGVDVDQPRNLAKSVTVE